MATLAGTKTRVQGHLLKEAWPSEQGPPNKIELQTPSSCGNAPALPQRFPRLFRGKSSLVYCSTLAVRFAKAGKGYKDRT